MPDETIAEPPPQIQVFDTMPTRLSDSEEQRSSRSARWTRKLFSGKPRDGVDSAKRDVTIALNGGPPTSGAQDPKVEETDAIQHVAGTGHTVNSPADAVNPAEPGKPASIASSAGPSRSASQGLNVDHVKDSSRRSSSSSMLRRADSAQGDNGLDPSAGAGALSAVSGRSRSTAGSDDEIDQSRAASPSRLADGIDSREDGQAEVYRIEFYRKDQPYFWLSNSSESPVFLDGVKYPTAEHLFQALKFLPSRPDISRKVRKASTATDAMREARKNMAHVKRGWISQGKNVEAMRLVLLLKFSQHSKLSRQLLMTGDADLIEASPTDAFWGAAMGGSSGGVSGLGRNELGKALQRTRETIRNQAGLGFGSAAQTV